MGPWIGAERITEDNLAVPRHDVCPLRKLRINAGLTQRELAERIGVTREAVCLVEIGRSDFSLLIWIRMCGIFHCSVEAARGGLVGIPETRRHRQLFKGDWEREHYFRAVERYNEYLEYMCLSGE